MVPGYLKNPTEERGKYLTLYFNFSAVLKDKDNRTGLILTTTASLNLILLQKKYKDYIPQM
jgi:hypothetical protein